MASQGLSRKRPAPGTSPAQYQQPQISNGYGLPGPQLSNDQFLQWGQVQAAQSSPSMNDASPYDQPAVKTERDSVPPSSQLARIPLNQIVPQDQTYNDSNGLQWMEPSNGTGQQTDGAWADDLTELERKAQVAKKEAQAKRKQIPPFVLKLSSFLQDGNRTDLIRWSEDGRSFIVIDEDEFAKTLIPELFKHNNYASFVRQLNMYGFHKKVGLSDNSMRASERKNKSPSEYSNPYFVRDHPELLWLIQKPKNVGGQAPKPKGRNKADGELNDDDNDDFIEEVPIGQDVRARPRGQLAIGSGEASLSREQLTNVHRELQAVRHQQAQISRMMSQLRREHEQLYGQATTFQDQHTRHENSINAILTFLATVYNRSLQGHEGAQGIANLFAGSIPHDSNQGNVVDVGDFSFDQLNGADGSIAKPFKRQPLLLQAPPTDFQSGRVSATPPATSTENPLPNRPNSRISQTMRNGGVSQSGNIQELFDPQSGTLDQPNRQTPSSSARSPQGDIMSVIQNTNARNSLPGTPAPDFSNVLSSLENAGGNTPLTNSQRADMLRLINNSANQPGGDSALVTPTPPPMPTNFDRRLASTKADIDSLAKMQAEQDRSVQNLTSLLQPLSPTGSIPGIGDGANIHPPHLDIDEFLNVGPNEYFTDFPENSFDFNGAEANGNGNGFNFADLNDGDDELFANMPATGNQQREGLNDYGIFNNGQAEEDGGGRVESVASSEVTTPANTADSDGVTGRGKGRRSSLVDGGRSPAKRRKRNT